MINEHFELRPSAVDLNRYMCATAREFFLSLFLHWPCVRMFGAVHLEVIESLAHKLNQHLLTYLFRDREDDLILVRDMFIAQDLSQMISRLVEEFPGSPQQYLLAIVLKAIQEEVQTETKFEHRNIEFPSLEGLAGPELLKAMIALVCGPVPEVEEPINDEELCTLVDLLTDLRYITTPFAIFDSIEITDFENSITAPVICGKYEAIIKTIAWANVKVQEALRDLGLTLRMLTRNRLAEAKREAREQAHDPHTQQPFIQVCIAGMCKRPFEDKK
jgi:hypothetical protein